MARPTAAKTEQGEHAPVSASQSAWPLAWILHRATEVVGAGEDERRDEEHARSRQRCPSVCSSAKRHRSAGLLEPHPEEDVERAEDDDDDDLLHLLGIRALKSWKKTAPIAARPTRLFTKPTARCAQTQDPTNFHPKRTPQTMAHVPTVQNDDVGVVARDEEVALSSARTAPPRLAPRSRPGGRPPVAEVLLAAQRTARGRRRHTERRRAEAERKRDLLAEGCRR